MNFEVGGSHISDDGKTLVGEYNESVDDQLNNTYHYAGT